MCVRALGDGGGGGLTDRFFVCAVAGGTWLEVKCLKGYVAVKSLGTTAVDKLALSLAAGSLAVFFLTTACT